MNPHTRDRIHGFITDSLPEEEVYVLLDQIERDPEVAEGLANALDLQGKLRADKFCRSKDSQRSKEAVLSAIQAPNYSQRVIRAIRPRRSPHLLLSILAAAAALIAGFIYWQTNQASTFGEIYSAGVGIDISRGNQRFPAKSGTELRHGDVLIVSAATESAEIRLADGTRIQTDGETAVIVRVVDEAKHLHLLVGALESDVRPQPAGKPLVITSTIARATVVGTRLRVAVSDASTRLDVHNGAVEFVNQAEDRIMVEAGQYAIAKNGEKRIQTPERQIAPDPASLVAFNRWKNYGKLIADDPSVVVWYDFQDDTEMGMLPARVFNSSGGDSAHTNNADGRIYNASWSDGRFPGLKKALLFQNRAFVECGRDAAFRFHGPFTVSIWFRVLAFTEGHACPTSIGYHGWGFQRNKTAESLEFYYYADQKYQNAFGKTSVSDGNWHCATAVFDGSQLQLYVDGRLDGKTLVQGNRHASIDPLIIGANIDPNGDPNRFFQGWIDEYLLFSRALSQEEVRSIYEAGRPAENAVDTPIIQP